MKNTIKSHIKELQCVISDTQWMIDNFRTMRRHGCAVLKIAEQEMQDLQKLLREIKKKYKNPTNGEENNMDKETDDTPDMLSTTWY